MFDEEANVEAARPTERPPALGYTVVVRALRLSPREFQGRFRDVWRVIASWGRYVDEEAGDWPSDEVCLAALPSEFSRELQVHRRDDLDGWLADLHDRDWILWSVSTDKDKVRFDLSADSMPISTWPLRFVTQILGADIVYADMWKSATD